MTARPATVPAPTPGLLPTDRLERVWGWSRATSAMSWVYRPSTVAGVEEVFALARASGRSVGLRGAGQSYGDAALNAEQICLDVSRMRRVLAWNPKQGIIHVEPGVTIADVWRYALEDGWWPAVVPGTMYASIGGCAAMNVHGKNNWKAGPIGEHILDVDLLLPNGELRRLSRAEHPELFHAAIGGFGMLGCITAIGLRLHRIHSGLLDVEALSARDLEEMIGIFDARAGSADYLVGWVDAASRPPRVGRGIVHQANYLAPGADPSPAQTLRVVNQELPETLFGVVPKSVMWRLIRPLMNRPGVRVVNAVRHHLSRLRAPHRFQEAHAAFAFLFDYIPNWKLACGPGGFVQYQSFVPAAHATRVFHEQLTLAQRAGLVPYIGVLKRHRRDAFLMSHAVDGYSLALEFKLVAHNRPAVRALAGQFDRLVLDAGGRFYFAKDLLLEPATVRAFLGDDVVRRFLDLKRSCDPEERLQTNLYRRLFPS
jgi:decaprenylphospho-beta-D-ribofuranose 2-oxidase